MMNEILLETTPRSGWVFTQSGKNSILWTQETHLSNLRGCDPVSRVLFIKVKEPVRQKMGFLSCS